MGKGQGAAGWAQAMAEFSEALRKDRYVSPVDDRKNWKSILSRAPFSMSQDELILVVKTLQSTGEGNR